MTPEAITEMKRMLREKEMKLTDIRLDALTSAHQLEQLRDAMTKMKVCKHRFLTRVDYLVFYFMRKQSKLLLAGSTRCNKKNKISHFKVTLLGSCMIKKLYSF